MMLDQCRRDFSALIDRINVQDAFEKADYKDRCKKLMLKTHQQYRPGEATCTCNVDVSFLKFEVP